MKGKRTSEDERSKIVKRAMKGESVEDLANELSMSTFTINDWVRDFKRNSNSKGVKRKVKTQKTTRPRRNIAQEKRIKELEDEVDFWKNQYNEIFYQRNG